MKQIITIFTVILCALFLSGCETGQGFEKDMKKAGNWINKTVKKATKKN